MNKKVFAYLNIEHPMVAWEVAIGRIKSVCDKNDNKFGVSLWYYNLIQKYIKAPDANRVINEFKLESIRQEKFSNKVSRLQGVYFFKSRDIAEIALDRWGLSKNKKYISEIYFSGNNYTEVDSEWITSFIDSKKTDWMENYWKGETLGSNPLTEVLASGIGIIQDNDLRMKAYYNVINQWPNTSTLLNSCIATFAEKKIERIGLSKPAIINDNGIIRGQFYIDMNDFNKRQPEVIESLKLATQKGMNLPYIIPNDSEKFFSVQDLRDISFELDNKQAVELFENIHES